MNETIPSCPICGSPMILRTARRGRNRGGQFYGCPRYPQCTGTVSLGETDTQAQEPSREFTTSDGLSRRLYPRPDQPSCQAILFETSALPRGVIALAHDELEPQYHRALVQWQLDLTLGTDAILGFSPSVWLSVVEKVLKRGSIVPLNPPLEESLLRLSGASTPETDAEWLDTLCRFTSSDRPAPGWMEGFDSEEERNFVDVVLPDLGGAACTGWLMRQVPLDALAASATTEDTNRRVDFLLAHPAGPQLVIEIDGEQHHDARVADADRDDLLRAAGFDVLRIPAREIRVGSGNSLLELNTYLHGYLSPEPISEGIHTFLQLVRRAQQMQIVLIEALAKGLVAPDAEGRVRVTCHPGSLDADVADAFVRLVLDDVNLLIADVARLYEESPAQFCVSEGDGDTDLELVFAGDTPRSHGPRCYVRDIYIPVPVASEVSVSAPANVKNADRETCTRLLHRVFGFTEFREGQFEAIARTIQGKDTIVLLPTGAGKSVAYQLSALLRPGACIVVDPILSLMDDQMENLTAVGIDRCAQINSTVSVDEMEALLRLMSQGEYFFCFVAPERFQRENFRTSLRTMTAHTVVSAIAIDEAHCVSEWGHDFRPAYLNLARISRDYCGSGSYTPPIIALTGTASRSVLKDVQRELGIEEFDAIITPASFDRAELRYRIIPCRSSEKEARLLGLLHALPRDFGRTASAFFETPTGRAYPGLVFCPFVEGDYGIVRIGEQVSKTLQRPVPIYGGKAPRGWDENEWQARKKTVARGFKRDRFPVMACTKAFGMGIDKPNIRFTVHLQLPPSIESFYQEAGRAGRDGATAMCYVLCSNDYPDRTRRLLDPSLPVSEIAQRVKATRRIDDDDVTRDLWFQTNSFPGVEEDTKRLEAVLDEIGPLGEPRTISVRFADSQEQKERAIHRLLTIGVVSDYTVEHSSRTFKVRLSGNSNEGLVHALHRYVASYQREQADTMASRVANDADRPLNEFVRIVARELVTFVYDVIERSRRQALAEMLALCEDYGDDEEAFRTFLLNYLGTSAFSGDLDILIDAPSGGLFAALDTVEKVISTLDAGRLRGESGRALESYPNHPGLRLLRALSEAMTDSPNPETIRENVAASIRFAESMHSLDLTLVCQVVVSAARMIWRGRGGLAESFLIGALDGASDRRFVARIMADELPLEIAGPAIAELLNQMNVRVEKLLEV